MAKIGYVDAFKKYGATLKNPQWSVSAVSINNELVVSIWKQKLEFISEYKIQRYRDRLSRWNDTSPGRDELETNLRDAFDWKTRVRAVLADTPETSAVNHTTNLSKIAKSYIVKPEWVGIVTEFDGENYVIDFRKDDSY